MKGEKEADITKAIRKVLKEAVIWHFKHWGGPMSLPGIADILGIYEGKFLAIEVKRPGLSPTEKQSKFLDAVNRAGGIGFVAHSVDDVVRELHLPTLF